MTINCGRCNGMMVLDVYTATQWAELDARGCYRCIACGNYEDSLILHHRTQPVNLRQGPPPRMYGMVKR